MEYDECKKKGKLWFYKGHANQKLGNKEDALKDFTKAVTLNYYDIDIFEEIAETNISNSEKGFFLYYLKKYDDLIEAFKDSDEKCKLKVYYTALSHMELRKFKESCEEFEKLEDFKVPIIEELENNFIELGNEIKNCNQYKSAFVLKSKFKEFIEVYNRLKKEIEEFKKSVDTDKSTDVSYHLKGIICSLEEFKEKIEEGICFDNEKFKELEKYLDSYKQEDTEVPTESSKFKKLKKVIDKFEEIVRTSETHFIGSVFNEVKESNSKLLKEIEEQKTYFDSNLVTLEHELKIIYESFKDAKEIKNKKTCNIYQKLDSLNKYLIELNFIKNFGANSWYYRGLALRELRNDSNVQNILENLIKKEYESDIKRSDVENFKRVLNSENRDLKSQYKLWEENERKKFVNFIHAEFQKNISKHDTFLEKLEKCISVDEYSAYSWYFKAKIHKRLAEKNKEKEAFQKVVDIESQEAFKKALVEYEKNIKTFQNYYFYYEKALVLYELKRYKEAIDSLDELLKEEPENAKAWYQKGEILFKLSRYQEAKDALKKSIKYFEILTEENQNNPDHWYNKGVAHSSLAEVLGKPKKHQNDEEILKKNQDVKAEYEKAIKAFDNATILNPIYSLAWNNKGNVYTKLKKYNKAIEAFKKAVEINPNYDLAMHNQGNALSLMGEYEESIKIYSEVVDKNHNPSFYKSWNNKGLALYKLERYDEAIKAFDKAIEVNPTFADTWNNRGIVFYKLDIKSEAKKSFEKAFEIEPENARASNNLGAVFSWYGELDRAKKLFEHTIQEDSDNVLGHANLAELFLNSGSVEKASKEVKEALDLVDYNTDDDISLAYVHCLDGRIKIEGQSKDENGKYGEAVESFEKATSYDVEDPTLILWSVYGKYLCQKFGTNEKDKNGDESNKDQSDEKEESSEESKANSGNTSSETGEKNSNEHFLSIISDLERVLHFCNRPAIKRNSLSESIHRNASMRNFLFICSIFIILLTIFLISQVRHFDLINEFLDWIWGLIQNLMLIIILFILIFFISVFLLVGLVVKDLEDLNVLKKEIPLLYSPAMKIFHFESIFEIIRSALKSMVSNTIDVETESLGQKKSATSIDPELKSAIKINTQLAKFDCHKEIKAYALYLLGYFYYKLQDYNTAKEKLQECIRLKSGTKTDKAAKNLLANIWKHEIKPPFWTYWFNSPVETWRRRSFGIFISLGILLLLFVHPENSAPATLEEYPWNTTDGEQKAGDLTPIGISINNSTLNITGPVQMNIYSSNISNDSNINKSSNNLSSIEMNIHSSKIFYDSNIKTLSNKSFLTNNSTSNIFVHIRMDIHSSTVNMSSTATNLSTNNTILYFNTSSNAATLWTNNTTFYVNTPSNARTLPINNTTLNISDYTQMNIHSSKIFYPSDDTAAPTNNTTLNLLVPTDVNIHPQIPDNAFAGILLLILILILIYPSIRIRDDIKVILNRKVAGTDIKVETGIEAPPEFNFELSPSLMQDVIKKLDENL